MKKILGLFLAFILCILLGLALPWMREMGVSLTRDEYSSLAGQGE